MGLVGSLPDLREDRKAEIVAHFQQIQRRMGVDGSQRHWNMKSNS